MKSDICFDSGLRVNDGNNSICSCDGFQLADDEITSATVGLVLDSLDDIHCITEAKHKDQVGGLQTISTQGCSAQGLGTRPLRYLSSPRSRRRITRMMFKVAR